MIHDIQKMEIQHYPQQNKTYRIFLLSCTISINLRLFFAIVGPSVTSRPGILRFDWRLFTEQLFHIRKVYLNLNNLKNIFARVMSSRKEKLLKRKLFINSRSIQYTFFFLSFLEDIFFQILFVFHIL